MFHFYGTLWQANRQADDHFNFVNFKPLQNNYVVKHFLKDNKQQDNTDLIEMKIIIVYQHFDKSFIISIDIQLLGYL